MARVRIKNHSLGSLMRSDEIGEFLESLAQPVLVAARRDPNDAYTATLRLRRFLTSGRSGRVSVQVGAAPVIGERVEAKRGTLARALGEAGL